MSPTLQDNLAALRRQRAWYRLRLGSLLLEAECARMAEVLPDLFGYHLLQVGAPADVDLLSTSRISHRIVLDADTGAHGAHPPQLYARPDALPIASDSVDVVVLPHTLEFAPDPHQVLREAERVLIAEGSVVILGFNPWSLWGVWRLLLMRGGEPPWCGRFLSLTRIRDWLALLGFDEIQMRPYFFRPPLHHTGVMHKLNFMEHLGARLWPKLAGAYLLVAKKRVSTLTPIKPRWRQRSLLGAGVAEPTVRNAEHVE
ncbi:MAG: methyltransferase domain-containing protein [Pseudomonadota bacterium]